MSNKKDLEILEKFKIAADLFKSNEANKNDKHSLKYLYLEWNFPHETIDMIYDYMGNSFDSTDEFLNILDGSDSIEEAWEFYKEKYDLPDQFPFNKTDE